MNQLLRIVALCITAALVCATLRSAHPQIATAAVLACGMAALLLSLEDIAGLSDLMQSLDELAGRPEQLHLLKLCGVAMVAEFASDLCRDAGETALANRIDVGMRIGIVAMALPYVSQLMEKIVNLLA